MKTRVPIGLTEFVGLADAHGIESFMSREDADAHFETMISLRAGSNRQRHAVVFAALLTENGEKAVTTQIEAGEFVNALKTLKNSALSLVCEEGWEKSWKLIPNPELDPWWSGVPDEFTEMVKAEKEAKKEEGRE